MNLTIVTAIRNACYLPKIMESVDNQTYQDFHHILVNDNSSEVRAEIEKYKDDKKRFWIDFRVRTHYYGALARNAGVMVAFSYVHHSKRDIENEWIVFHDEDNFWEPDHLQSMVDVATANPRATIIASDAIWIGRDDKSFREVRECKLKHGGCDLGQFMYKTSLFKKYGYFDPHPRAKHKYDFNLLKKIFECESVITTNKPTFLMNYKKK